MKKSLYIFLLILIIVLCSCNNSNITSTSSSSIPNSSDPAEEVYETIVLKADCQYDDSGKYNDDITSFPHFNQYYIHSSSTCDLIPDFIIAGDYIEYTYQQKVINGEQTLLATAMAPLVLTDDSDVKYTRAIVEEVDKDLIERNAYGTISSISYYTTFLTTVTIDREYNFVNLSEYKGDTLYFSYSQASYYNGRPYRLYSFNPLES